MRLACFLLRGFDSDEGVYFKVDELPNEVNEVIYLNKVFIGREPICLAS